MTYKDFLGLVVKADQSLRGNHAWTTPSEEDYDKNGIKCEWVIGGMTGGNYDGGEANIQREPDPEPNLDILEVLLAMIWPDMSYLKYRALERTLIERGHYTCTDYYGNYTIYATKKVDMKKLYNFINDHIDKTLLEVNDDSEE